MTKRKKKNAPHLGPNLRRLRVKHGLTQNGLAHLLKLKGSNAGAYICRIECGVQVPRLDMIQRMAEVFDVNLTELVSREGVRQ